MARSLPAVLMDNIVRALVARSGRDPIFDLPPPAGPEKPWTPPQTHGHTVEALPNAAIEILSVAGNTSDKIVYHIHGGGFVQGLTNARRDMGLCISRFGKNCAVALLDYRIAPKHIHPAGLEDALDGWDFLVANGYRDIVVTGDSAGGNLAMALVCALRDRGGLQPRAVFCMAPLLDAGLRGASFQFNMYRDACLGYPKTYLPLTPTQHRRHVYAGDCDVNDPALSPLFANLADLPPVFLQVGTWDRLLSDSIDFAERAKEQGSAVQVSLYDQMFHAFQFGPLWIPEVKRAWNELGSFLSTHL